MITTMSDSDILGSIVSYIVGVIFIVSHYAVDALDGHETPEFRYIARNSILWPLCTIAILVVLLAWLSLPIIKPIFRYFRNRKIPKARVVVNLEQALGRTYRPGQPTKMVEFTIYKERP